MHQIFFNVRLYAKQKINLTWPNKISRLYSKYVVSDEFILDFFNTPCAIYSMSKESKQTAIFLSINNETQCVTLLCLSSGFMTYSPSFILGKLFLEKTPLNLQ